MKLLCSLVELHGSSMWLKCFVGNYLFHWDIAIKSYYIFPLGSWSFKTDENILKQHDIECSQFTVHTG